MTRLFEVLPVEEIRAIQLRIFNDPDVPYLRKGPFSDATHRQIEQRIRNVQGHNVSRILDAVEPLDQSNWKQAWSHYMALSAGTHPWPDANHRTGMTTFAEAYHKVYKLIAQMLPKDSTAMVVASKAMRDGDRLKRKGKARHYSVHELSDPDHPYRALFRRYESRMFLTDARRVTGS